MDVFVSFYFVNPYFTGPRGSSISQGVIQWRIILDPLIWVGHRYSTYILHLGIKIQIKLSPFCQGDWWGKETTQYMIKCNKVLCVGGWRNKHRYQMIQRKESSIPPEEEGGGQKRLYKEMKYLLLTAHQLY